MPILTLLTKSVIGFVNASILDFLTMLSPPVKVAYYIVFDYSLDSNSTKNAKKYQVPNKAGPWAETRQRKI